MVDCPAIDTHSVALKGSLRRQWINSYSYASIHHPTLHLPATLLFWQIHPLNSLTLNFPGIWAQPLKPSSSFLKKFPHFSKKKEKVFAFFKPFQAYKCSWLTKSYSQHFHIDHWEHDLDIHDTSDSAKHHYSQIISECFQTLEAGH